MNLNITNNAQILFLFLIFFISGCKKNEINLVEATFNNSLSIEEAKNWYTSSTTSSQSSISKRNSSKRLFNDFVPKWNNAVATSDENYEIVELPLQFAKNPGFTAADTSEKVKQRINGVTHLLILKDKKTGNMKSVLMNIFSDNGIADSSITYSKRKANFNGNIFFTNLNGDFINGWQYENGKITNRLGKLKNENKSGSISNRNVSPNNIKEDPDCSMAEYRVYERICYFGEPESSCTQWYYIGSIYVNTCPTGAGGDGGGGVDEDDEAENLCEKYKNNFLSNTNVVSETIGFEIVPIDLLKKYKNPRWMILKNLTWNLYSQEKGIVKLIDPGNDTWVWESLTHESIGMTGTSFGGTVTFSQGTGTPSFVPGAPNVRYGGMSVNFDVIYTPLNCLTELKSNYTSNAIWEAHP